jgi:hypothetical protein
LQGKGIPGLPFRIRAGFRANKNGGQGHRQTLRCPDMRLVMVLYRCS